MDDLPITSIRKVRICPEHACRIFDAEQLLVRLEKGEFRLRIVSKPMHPPKPDHFGRLRVATEEHFLHDDRFDRRDVRHLILRAHCFRLEDGSIGASGKLDPKEMLIGDIQYRQLEFENPRCALCEGGDMIPHGERFWSSRYKPGGPAGPGGTAQP